MPSRVLPSDEVTLALAYDAMKCRYAHSCREYSRRLGSLPAALRPCLRASSLSVRPVSESATAVWGMGRSDLVGPLGIGDLDDLRGNTLISLPRWNGIVSTLDPKVAERAPERNRCVLA